ncbi:hypothetical protein CG710_020285 [Lachnotalea glycerini]|uniref:Transposase IS66 central domain-containing protein n=1 Tax=Lachnotalea glycerini TaxID=1763509 RepID=A0A371J539_9FIRM|nr:hypothetical protein CG710_020285 [Lachnotalea glycerini]
MGKNYCDQLFKLKQVFSELPPKERKQQRLEQAAPILEAFWSWLETVSALKNSKLNKAVTYE